MAWKPIIALSGVVQQDGVEVIGAKVHLTDEPITIRVDVVVPFDPEQSVRSVREYAAAQAIAAIEQALVYLRSSSPRELEEADRAALHEPSEYLSDLP